VLLVPAFVRRLEYVYRHFVARIPDKFLRNTMNYFDNFWGSDAEISRNCVTRTPDKFLRNTMNYFDNFWGSDAEISRDFVARTPDKFLRNTMNYFYNFCWFRRCNFSDFFRAYSRRVLTQHHELFR
jgi:hypothetical protein